MKQFTTVTFGSLPIGAEFFSRDCMLSHGESNMVYSLEKYVKIGASSALRVTHAPFTYTDINNDVGVELEVKPKVLKTLEQADAERRAAYEAAEQRRMAETGFVGNGIACPSCCAELNDVQGITLLSNPPKKRIVCHKCDYSGTRLA
jgi:hypothetical protein